MFIFTINSWDQSNQQLIGSYCCKKKSSDRNEEEEVRLGLVHVQSTQCDVFCNSASDNFPCKELVEEIIITWYTVTQSQQKKLIGRKQQELDDCIMVRWCFPFISGFDPRLLFWKWCFITQAFVSHLCILHVFKRLPVTIRCDIFWIPCAIVLERFWNPALRALEMGIVQGERERERMCVCRLSLLPYL